MNFCRFIVNCLAGSLLLPALNAQGLRDPQFMAQAQPGFTDIYNIDYDQADRVFLALEKRFPEHPAPPQYLATIAWLRELFRRQDLDLDLFLSPSFFTKETTQAMPPEQRKAFFDYMQESQALSQKLLQANPKNQDAIYFLGASYGILASFAITIDHSLRKAFSYGNKAYDCDRQVLKLTPDYYDAYMTVGLYQYIVGSIPWYIKWLAALAGYHGTKDEGFRQLNVAVAKGNYVKVDAKILQMVLLMREGRPKEALQDARELHRDYPRNFIFQINIAQILEKLGETDQAATEYLDVVRQAEQATPNYQLVAMSTFRYALGNKLLSLGRAPAAREQLEKSVANPSTPERERVLSQLRLGQALDVEGKRDQAVERYQTVLRMKDVEDSRDLARKFIRKPYGK